MNDENLIPMNKRTESEQREMQSKGGIASGKARRKKKTLKEIAEIIGNTVDIKNAKKVKKNFPDVDDEDITYNFELIISMYQKALKGDVKASNFIADTLGESYRAKKDDDIVIVVEDIEDIEDEIFSKE